MFDPMDPSLQPDETSPFVAPSLTKPKPTTPDLNTNTLGPCPTRANQQTLSQHKTNTPDSYPTINTELTPTEIPPKIITNESCPMQVQRCNSPSPDLPLVENPITVHINDQEVDLTSDVLERLMSEDISNLLTKG